MGILIAIALQAGFPAMTVPDVSVGRCGNRTHLEADVRKHTKSEMVAEYKRPATVVEAKMKDRTGGAASMNVPGLTYDQPLALRNERTGKVTHFRNIVTHRKPVVVPASEGRAGSASARDQYTVTKSAATPDANTCDKD